MIVALMYVRATGMPRQANKISRLAGLAIGHRRLRWTYRLPRFDAAAKKGIDRFGECRARLVETGISSKHTGVAGSGTVALLPADTADAGGA